MKHVKFLAAAAGTLGVLIAGAAHAAGEGHKWDGNHSTPVHLLPMVDEEGHRILPSFDMPMPMSVRNTCGPCHDYDTIASGFHFNSSADGQSPGRKGEPWVWVDELTGTQMPLSYRGWEGTYEPNDIGISDWEFTKQFGRHMPGGDMGEPDSLYGDPESRWQVTGGLEINCLGCHNESPLQDQSEWAKQIARENWRWAATAASELASVSGMAMRLPDFWQIHDGFSPDDKSWATPPVVQYEVDAFDAKNLTQFKVQYRMDDENCLFCHSASDSHTERWEQEIDVHRTSGMKCVDCHRNGLNHDIVRGYETEAAEKGNPVFYDFSCAGCHMGNPDGEGISEHGGRLGAPKPLHEGLPEIHFEVLSCTACHSGKWPEDATHSMRTSRINRTGIHGVAQWFTEHPYVAEPVFLKGEDGKIAPHRAVWPSFWAKVDGEDVTPVPPEEVTDVATGILDLEEQIGTFITNMSTLTLSSEVAESMRGLVCLLTPGKDFRVNYDGKLDYKEYDASEAGKTPSAEAIADGSAKEKIWYPEFDGPYIWGIEKDIVRKDEFDMAVTDDEGSIIVDYVQVQPLVNDFEPMMPDDAEFDYGTYDEIDGAIKTLAYKNEALGEAVIVNGNILYYRTPDALLAGEEFTGEPTDVPTPFFRRTNEDGEIEYTSLLPELAPDSIQVTSMTDIAFTEAQVAEMLRALEARDGETYGYVGGGQLFTLDGMQLASVEHVAAEPYTWPIGHEVRPAEQSLGIAGCTDCHANDAPFLMTEFASDGPLATDTAVASTMYENFGMLDAEYPRIALFFKMLIVVTMTLLLIHIALDVYRQMTRSAAAK